MSDTFKKYIETLLTPALLLATVLAITLAAMEYRTLRLAERVEDTTQLLPGVGRSQPELLETGRWLEYYGGGSGIDRVVARDYESVRITTGGDGGWYGARTNLEATDFTNQAISFNVRVDDWQAIERYMIIFASDNGEFQNYFGLNLKQFFAFPADDEWMTIIVEKSEFEVIEGMPDWSNITDIALRIVPKIGTATRVWFDDVAIIPKVANQAVVSMTFDDGFDAVIEAYALMSEYDMKGTLYVIPEFVDTPGYLTQTQIDSLAQAGWDISAHGKTNLLDMGFADTDTDLAKVYAYLDQYEYQGREHFAFPNGGYDASNRSQVMEYYWTGRSIDGFSQPQDYFIPSSINAKTVSSSTPPSEVIGWIKNAEADKSWLNIVWHDFVSGEPEKDVEYNLDQYQEILAALTRSEVLILPFSEAFEFVQQPVEIEEEN